jgi:glycosyltransferase involved in cell wall biosynthesis
LAESLKRLANELGVSDTVYFLGLRNDVRDILSDADLLVHAALAETCTYVISEAMCARVPSVVTDAGASREQIVSGETGYVVTQDDADAFVDNVTLVLSDASLRTAMGVAARQRWEQRYTIDRAVETYYDICQRVLAGPDV